MAGSPGSRAGGPTGLAETSSGPTRLHGPVVNPSSDLSTNHGAQFNVDLAVQLGRLRLPNPILVASGTFGYAREMAGFVDLGRLGGIIPKTITPQPRGGNAPWRHGRNAFGNAQFDRAG